MIDRRHLLLSLGAAGLSACTRQSAEVSTGLLQDGPTGRFVEAGGVRLHYQRIGAKGPKLIALHGASGNLRDWLLGPGPALARTHQVLLFDRPGFGYSQRALRNGQLLTVQAALLRRAAAQLGFERAKLLGHSFGGSVALAWALGAPESVSGLMLLGAPSQVWEGGLGLLNRVTGAPVIGPVAARVLPAFASDRLVRDTVTRIFAPQSPPPGYVENVGAALSLRPETIRNNAADLNALKEGVRAMVPRYPTLPMPIEILHGTADQTVPINIHAIPLSGQLPEARFTPLEGIGHMPHHAATTAMLEAAARLP